MVVSVKERVFMKVNKVSKLIVLLASTALISACGNTRSSSTMESSNEPSSSEQVITSSNEQVS